MRKKYLFICLLLIVCISPYQSYSFNEKIGFLDIQTIMQNTDSGKLAAKDFKNLYVKVTARISDAEKDLKSRKADLEKNGSNMTAAAREAANSDYLKRYNAYVLLVENANALLKKADQEMTNELTPQVVKVARVFGKKKSYTKIIDSKSQMNLMDSTEKNISDFSYSKDNDITSRIIEECNKYPITYSSLKHYATLDIDSILKETHQKIPQEVGSNQAAAKMQSKEESAFDILKKRYAKGEITKREFDEMKKDLQDDTIAHSTNQAGNASIETTKTVASLMEQARAEGKIGNTRSLIDILSKVIDIDHGNGEAYYERGAGHYILGENDDSIEDYTKAIALKYKVSESMSNRGMVYLVMGNYSKAKEDFDMSIESQPSSAAYSNRASYYIMLKDYRSAIRDGRQAISLNPKDAKSCFNVASAYVGLGDTRNGVEFLQQACDLGYQRACEILKQRFGR